MWTNVRSESSEIMPSLVYSDTAPTVVVKGMICRVTASAAHVVPDSVKLGVGLPVGSFSFAYAVFVEAAARGGVIRLFEIVFKGFGFVSAVANATPPVMKTTTFCGPVNGSIDVLNSDQSTETLIGEIINAGHRNLLTGRMFKWGQAVTCPCAIIH